MNVLLIEDDKNLAESLLSYLKMEGFKVTHCENLEKARLEKHNEFKLIILDWMLPDGQGIDFLKELREGECNTPVIMLTARADLIDKVIGLESGANDYMTKPFEPRELIARIRVQLRLSKPTSEENLSDIVDINGVVIDSLKRIVTFKRKEVTLTKMEFDLLKLLASYPDRPFSRDELLNKVWGFENYPTTRTVDTHILQLRNKFDESFIETVRGIGYKFKQL
jgi:DNA-binding response OmpR family regulator